MHEINVTLYKRSESPFYFMRYCDSAGKQHRRSTRKRTLREAERVAGAWERELRDGKSAMRMGGMLWADFRARYEEEVLPGLADTTEKKAIGVFNSLDEHASPKRLRDITPDMLSQYQSAMRTAKRAESTIKGHLATIRAALSWAKGQGLIAAIPTFPKSQRAKTSKVMKGRPITAEEFERMIAAVPKVIRKPNLGRKRKQAPVDVERVPSWEHLVRGLWLSGLRLGEALALRWEEPAGLLVDFTCRHPMLRIDAEAEKGHRDRLLPLSPEFARFLEQTPKSQRRGYVFNPRGQRSSERLSVQQAGKVVQAIGEAANVVVDRAGTENPKFASAHDLRRSFGARWAEHVMPQVLMELMRHSAIETTLKYYVGQNAQRTAAILWEADAAAEKHTSNTVAENRSAESRQTQEN